MMAMMESFAAFMLEKYNVIAFLLLVPAALVGAIVVGGYQRPLKKIATVIKERLYVRRVIVTKTFEERKKKKEATTESEEPTVSGLYIHPVKSVTPVSVQTATIDRKGFVGDRRFMVVTRRPLPIWKTEFDADDWTHRMVTQASCPSMATIVADLDDNDNKHEMTLTCKPLGIHVTFSTKPPRDAPKYRAKIWEDEIMVQDLGDEVAAFLRKVMDYDTTVPNQWKPGVRLVAQTKEDTRTSCEWYTPPRARNLLGRPPQVSCHDDFPILIITQASLDDLNRRLVAAGHDSVEMKRFRPNIVIAGKNMEPFEEDEWKVIAIGGAFFHIVKGCLRCKLTTIDPTSDKPKIGEQPLEMLQEFRTKTSNDEHIYFGQYAIPVSGSIGKKVSVGSKVKIMYRGDPTWADSDDSD